MKTSKTVTAAGIFLAAGAVLAAMAPAARADGSGASCHSVCMPSICWGGGPIRDDSNKRPVQEVRGFVGGSPRIQSLSQPVGLGGRIAGGDVGHGVVSYGSTRNGMAPVNTGTPAVINIRPVDQQGAQWIARPLGNPIHSTNITPINPIAGSGTNTGS